MSIIYNNKVVAGKYAQQVVADADTVNAGIIKIATEEQINEGIDNATAVTPFYLAQKQDKISAGDDIVINNNEISCTIKPDEQTIVRKNNGTMQCIGQLTKSNTLKFDWEGTQAEYNVAYLNGTIQPDWYCYITDDEEFVDYGDIANQSLSNLKAEGEARFTAKADTDLSNLRPEGEARFTAKSDTDLSNLTEAGLKVIKDNSGSGLELCDIGMSLYVDESKGLRRYLNGQIVDINTNTQAFLNRLLEIKNTNPDYFATEENWQAEALLNIDGCVYKFVLNYSSDGETVVSVRLPKYPDYVEINAGGTLPVVGNGKTLGFTDGNSSHNGGSIGFYGGELRGNYSQQNLPVGSNLLVDGTKYFTNNVLLGVSTDSTKSGIQTTLKQTKLKMRYFIQIATGSETENNIINEIELNNPYSLFDSKYSDHELNNLSWLKSEGQWNAKAVYPTAYDKLLKVYNGTETVEGLSVKLSTETYTDYDFVLNTADEKFRLPLKTKLASGKAVVGNGMTLGLTNGTDNYGLITGALVGTDDRYYLGQSSAGYGQSIGNHTAGTKATLDISTGITTDPTKSGIETSDSGLYLYFYVGETVQNANLIDAGRIGEQLANKQDKLIRYPIAVSNKSLMPSWYVVYNDGWCEQGGRYTINTNGSGTITFLKEFVDTSYTILNNKESTDSSTWNVMFNNLETWTTSSIVIKANLTGYTLGGTWEAKGYIK